MITFRDSKYIINLYTGLHYEILSTDLLVRTLYSIVDSILRKKQLDSFP